MDYKSVFTNLCLELQQNRSWIKGLGKNPFTHSIPFHSLIPWRQCLYSGGTEACSLGLRETPASSNVCHSHEWRVDTASGMTLKKQNACYGVYTLSDMRSKKKLHVYTASEAKGLTLTMLNATRCNKCKKLLQLHLILPSTDVCIALYTRCFPSVCGKNF